VLHLKTHSKHIKAIPQCEICHLNFSSGSRLKAHIKGSHTGETRKECSICLRTYKSVQKMKLHMESHRRHPCDYCFKSFKDPMGLARHVMLEHSGAKLVQDKHLPELSTVTARPTACKVHFNIKRGCEACIEAREERTLIGSRGL
jgi:uncharacterized Zn-finger protein